MVDPAPEPTVVPGDCVVFVPAFCAGAAAAWRWANTVASAAPCGTTHVLPAVLAVASASLYCRFARSVGLTPYCCNANCMISENTGAATSPP